MITTKAELKNHIKTEKKAYVDKSLEHRIEQLIVSDPRLKVFKFQKTLRREAYHHNNKGIYHKFMYALCRRKRNKLGLKLSIEICDNTFDKGLTIAHAGNIVVNGHAKVGKNCYLHGSNCIGNSGLSSACPTIGDNVRIGVGAKVIGGVTIADNIKIAAGAVVVHSFLEEGITIAGVPAKKVK